MSTPLLLSDPASSIVPPSHLTPPVVRSTEFAFVYPEGGYPAGMPRYRPATWQGSAVVAEQVFKDIQAEGGPLSPFILATLGCLRHECIVPLLAASQDRAVASCPLLLVFPKSRLWPTLEHWVATEGCFATHPNRLVLVAERMARAIAHFHTRGVVLGALTPGSFVVSHVNATTKDTTTDDDNDEDPRCVLLAEYDHAACVEVDGLLPAAKLDLGKATVDPRWSAPEIHNDVSRVGFPVDVFSLGALLYFCITGVAPRVTSSSSLQPMVGVAEDDSSEHRDERFGLLHGLLVEKVVPDVVSPRRSPFPPRRDPPAEFLQLVRRCLSYDPLQRPTAVELRQHLESLRYSLAD